MLQAALNQAVARSTGDDCDVINRRGFSLVESASAIDESDFDALVADWDFLQQEIDSHRFEESYWNTPVVLHPHSKLSRSRRRAARTAQARRTGGAAH